MMHKTFTVTLAIVALISANSNALADGSLPPVVTHAASRPGEPPLVSLRTEHLGAMVARNAAEDTGLTEIANNFTQYPNSPYWGWLGYAVLGPGQGAGKGTEQWLATAFTPKANHVATKVEVAAEFDYGTNAVVLSLYDDAGGMPGKSLRSWQLTNLPHAVCCTVASGSDKRGIPLTGGKQYWVVMRTNAKDSDSVVVWALTEFANVQKHGASWALYCNGPGCPSTWKNPGWNIFTHTLYGLAFAVFGK
ncbi:MAG: choice-of-anchor R domain-containing protein [Candidatus Cybelea sp.]